MIKCLIAGKEIQTGVYTYGFATRIGDLGSAEIKYVDTFLAAQLDKEGDSSLHGALDSVGSPGQPVEWRDKTN